MYEYKKLKAFCDKMKEEYSDDIIIKESDKDYYERIDDLLNGYVPSSWNILNIIQLAYKTEMLSNIFNTDFSTNYIKGEEEKINDWNEYFEGNEFKYEYFDQGHTLHFNDVNRTKNMDVVNYLLNINKIISGYLSDYLNRLLQPTKNIKGKTYGKEYYHMLTYENNIGMIIEVLEDLKEYHNVKDVSVLLEWLNKINKKQQKFKGDWQKSNNDNELINYIASDTGYVTPTSFYNSSYIKAINNCFTTEGGEIILQLYRQKISKVPLYRYWTMCDFNEFDIKREDDDIKQTRIMRNYIKGTGYSKNLLDDIETAKSNIDENLYTLLPYKASFKLFLKWISVFDKKNVEDTINFDFNAEMDKIFEAYADFKEEYDRVKDIYSNKIVEISDKIAEKEQEKNNINKKLTQLIGANKQLLSEQIKLIERLTFLDGSLIKLKNKTQSEQQKQEAQKVLWQNEKKQVESKMLSLEQNINDNSNEQSQIQAKLQKKQGEITDLKFQLKSITTDKLGKKIIDDGSIESMNAVVEIIENKQLLFNNETIDRDKIGKHYIHEYMNNNIIINVKNEYTNSNIKIKPKPYNKKGIKRILKGVGKTSYDPPEVKINNTIKNNIDDFINNLELPFLFSKNVDEYRKKLGRDIVNVLHNDMENLKKTIQEDGVEMNVFNFLYYYNYFYNALHRDDPAVVKQALIDYFPAIDLYKIFPPP